MIQNDAELEESKRNLSSLLDGVEQIRQELKQEGFKEEAINITTAGTQIIAYEMNYDIEEYEKRRKNPCPFEKQKNLL